MTTKKKRKARKAKAQRRKAETKKQEAVPRPTSIVPRPSSAPNSLNDLNGLNRLNDEKQPSAWQLRPVDGQGIYTRYFQNYVPRKVEADFYEFLREAVPIIDAAIQRLTNLDGHLVVTGGNDRLVDEIQDWIDNVPVNDIQAGFQAFHQSMTSETFEQGFSLSEFITDKKRNDIVGLRVADSKFVKFKRTPAGLDIYQKGNDDHDYRRLKARDNLMYFSINNENQNPYGTALMRSCEFVSKALVTMQNSVMNVWERFGDPSFEIIYKTSKKDGKDHASRRKQMQDDLNTALSAKRKGNSADFVYAIDKDSDITIKVIGADNQILELEVPSRHVLEQIVSKTGLPPWMLGMHWSTTERLSDAEAAMVSADVATRQAAKMPRFKKLVRNLLLLRGRTWKKGDWDIEWAQVNLRDIVKQAQAEFLSAQANMMRANELPPPQGERGYSPHSPGVARTNSFVRVGDKLVCPCCSNKSSLVSRLSSLVSKEISRPTPWPELDETEDNYEKEIKYDWHELTKQTFAILNLPADEFSSTPAPAVPREQQLAKTPNSLNGLNGLNGLAGLNDLNGLNGLNDLNDLNDDKQPPETIPEIEAFAYTTEQRAFIMQALEEFKGKYDWRDTNSAVRWYYGQAYSLGLIQAAHLIGKERPILDIIKNREIFDEIARSGFTLVKDNATKGIIAKIIPEMEAQMIAGANPRHVAARLKKLFEDKNSDWERLARTEMTVAAEKAKVDEWKAWKIKKIAFVIAPDGCPICQGLVGEYEITKAPIPGADTHPRCRCTLAPV